MEISKPPLWRNVLEWIGSFVIIVVALVIIVIVTIVALTTTTFGALSRIPFTDYSECAAALEQITPNPDYRHSDVGWSYSLVEIRTPGTDADMYSRTTYLCDHSVDPVTLQIAKHDISDWR